MSRTWRSVILPVMVSMVAVTALVACSHSENKPAPITSVESSTHQQTMASRQTIALPSQPIMYHRDYQQIPKGSYSNKTYQVKRGDTLFYIAWITGNDYRELARRNDITAPYALSVGQILHVGEDISKGGDENLHEVTQNSQIATKKLDSQTNNAYPYNPGNKGTVAQARQPDKTSTSAASTKGNTSVNSVKNSELVWRWPAQGKIVENFSPTVQGNKGIDIAGRRGEPVRSAAAGRVVYAGNALRGYGNLIIIKHDDDYLSAYAHNDAILVKEQQQIQAGQQIATMGSTGSSSVKLHFEIRYKGKSVNPLHYLPQR